MEMEAAGGAGLDLWACDAGAQEGGVGWSPSDGEQSCGAEAALRVQAECGGCSLDPGELRG